MSIAPTSPVTGSAQTGLTSPTYTLTSDTPPANNGKQYAVTALGGTQTGVDSHSVARPFTITAFRPQNLRVLGQPNPTTGRIADVPNNVYTIITRKGVTPLLGQPARIAIIESRISVPAGSDLADPANLRAMLSAHIGTLTQTSAGIGDTTVNGLL
jgi:hypothetical protein